MPPAKQRRLAKAYVLAFLEMTLKGKQGYRPMFQDYRVARHWLPDTIYLNQYQDSRTRMLATFEEDIDLSTGSLRGVKLVGEHLNTWYEKLVDLKWDAKHSNAVYLGWDNPEAHYTIRFPKLPWTMDGDWVVTFSLADASRAATADALDLTVAVEDQNGNEARLPLSHFSFLQPRLKAQYMKADLLNSLPPSEIVFQTFSFSLSEFATQNAAFDPVKLASISLIFDRSVSGMVALDHIGIRIPN